MINTVLSSISRLPNSQLLMSAIVNVEDGNGRRVQARALLDTCSTAHFISERFAKTLKLPMQTCSVPIGTISSNTTFAKNFITIKFHSIHNDFHKTLTFLTVPTICNLIPNETFPRDTIDIPVRCNLADPQFYLPRPVDILIGSGASLSLLLSGQIKLAHDGDLYLQKTQLGWVIAGELESNAIPKSASCNFVELNETLTRFLEDEEILAPKPKSLEETDCENHFVNNVSRDESGRYTVRLPFKETTTFPGSYSIALRRLNSLEKKLNKEPELKIEYSRVIQEYLDLNHMSLVDTVDIWDGYYMPHHSILKPSSDTTKLRVVFDASAKAQNGKSLNDTLMIGPTIQDKIFAHLVRFRSHSIVIMADIEKMYRQVNIHKDDRKFQRILWRIDGVVRVLESNTVTFGVASAPFSAIRSIHQLAEDEKESFPTAAKLLTRDLYVDDLLSGGEIVEEVKRARDEIIAMLKKGGFNIRQWASNHPEALQGLPETAINAKLQLDKTSPLKTLGISWASNNDTLFYSVTSPDPQAKITKTFILSEIAKIFDPLGLLGPVILQAKSIMQEVWKCKVDWTTPVPDDLKNRWLNFASELELLKTLSIDRHIFLPNHTSIQVHGFCDASEKGYGACIYIRSEDEHGNVGCRLVCAKSKVASMGKLTIPRLELNGARLLARLLKETTDALGLAPHKTFLWSDSTIVLHWIRTSPHLLQVYASHRVAEIQKLTNTSDWRHVRSQNNPADALSRGQFPSEFLKNEIWFNGPAWLCEPEENWPIGIGQLNDQLPEMKKKVCLALNTMNDELAKFSSYSKIVRIVAYCLRFLPSNKFTGKISIEEKRQAENRVIKIIQKSHFAEEIESLTNPDELKRTRLASLNPLVDKQGLLRVGGRLENANVSPETKCPILLPPNNHVTRLLIRETHENQYHSGVQSTLYAIRQRFWLIDGKNQVRKVTKKCTRCFRFKPKSADYKMGSLPADRVRESTPFSHVATDFLGPLFMKEKKLRNRNKVKVYVCVFVCLATKACHLETVTDLSTDSFIGSLRRFIAKRGIPVFIRSDNGSNYRGAKNQLNELYAMLNSQEFNEKIHEFASAKNIVWVMSTPLAPHQNGIAEAGVKSFKHHFKRVVGDRLLTLEELNTFVAEIEAILNSRPICPISSDPNDPQALTPGHFLIQRPITLLPEENLLSVPDNRLKSWQILSKMRQTFWNRWHVEYLGELQKLVKWQTNKPNLKTGTIVIIKEKDVPCARWQLGRIVEVHPGRDGVVRNATVRTANSTYTRCVSLLCPLPFDQ